MIAVGRRDPEFSWALMMQLRRDDKARLLARLRHRKHRSHLPLHKQQEEFEADDTSEERSACIFRPSNPRTERAGLVVFRSTSLISLVTSLTVQGRVRRANAVMCGSANGRNLDEVEG
jgi:hypothetical protein